MYRMQLRDAKDRTMNILSDHHSQVVPREGEKVSIRRKHDMVKRTNYRVTSVEYVLCEDDSGLDELFVYLTRVD